MKETRRLQDLHSVGPATIRDFERLGIGTVPKLARCDARRLYEKLCAVTGARHDPCAEDVFRAAIAQARDPKLPVEQARWWYWSRLRKAADRQYRARPPARSPRPAPAWAK